MRSGSQGYQSSTAQSIASLCKEPPPSASRQRTKHHSSNREQSHQRPPERISQRLEFTGERTTRLPFPPMEVRNLLQRLMKYSATEREKNQN